MATDKESSGSGLNERLKTLVLGLAALVLLAVVLVPLTCVGFAVAGFAACEADPDCSGGQSAE